MQYARNTRETGFLSLLFLPWLSRHSPLETTCWHCLVYSRSKTLIKRGAGGNCCAPLLPWTSCASNAFISLPLHPPSYIFTLDLTDSRLHARVSLYARTIPLKSLGISSTFRFEIGRIESRNSLQSCGWKKKFDYLLIKRFKRDIIFDCC